MSFGFINFEKGADNLVLVPFEIMIEKVEKAPNDVKNIEELQEGVKAQIQQLEDIEDGNDPKKKII